MWKLVYYSLLLYFMDVFFCCWHNRCELKIHLRKSDVGAVVLNRHDLYFLFFEGWDGWFWVSDLRRKTKKVNFVFKKELIIFCGSMWFTLMPSSLQCRLNDLTWRLYSRDVSTLAPSVFVQRAGVIVCWNQSIYVGAFI